MLRIQARFIVWGDSMPDHWFRWGKKYSTVCRALQARKDMMDAWPDLRFRIIHDNA